MKKKVSVILKQDNKRKRETQCIVNVARGYAFNYLIPNELAELATAKKVQHIKMFESIKTKKKEQNEIELQLIDNNIKKIKKISIYKKGGENNSIFGSITEKDIVKWISKYTNLFIHKLKLEILETKFTGIKYVKIQVHNKNTINIPLYIIPTNI
uniref:50S ribosomal protein L9, chloroplastic n=1 Tax=Pleurostichidium falkenbergii TaxID=121064 RepID=A0A4D6UWE8_9FLOR|nr:ribosomal protein L9 [Pleurostichidium falkenbergii]QCH39737.1 ribosomal protein L9 [Pleurostichidium falkenbergii]